MGAKFFYRNIDLVYFVNNKLIKNNLITQKDRMLLSFSGGQDSICFVFILNQLYSQLEFDITFFWCHHLWQTDSFYLMQQITKLSFLLQFNSCFPIPLNYISSELLARKWRQKCSYRVSLFYNYSKICLAHTFNDKVENIFLNFIRGTGLIGLAPLRWTQFISKYNITNEKYLSCFTSREYAKQNYLNNPCIPPTKMNSDPVRSERVEGLQIHFSGALQRGKTKINSHPNNISLREIPFVVALPLANQRFARGMRLSKVARFSNSMRHNFCASERHFLPSSVTEFHREQNFAKGYGILYASAIKLCQLGFASQLRVRRKPPSCYKSKIWVAKRYGIRSQAFEESPLQSFAPYEVQLRYWFILVGGIWKTCYVLTNDFFPHNGTRKLSEKSYYHTRIFRFSKRIISQRSPFIPTKMKGYLYSRRGYEASLKLNGSSTKMNPYPTVHFSGGYASNMCILQDNSDKLKNLTKQVIKKFIQRDSQLLQIEDLGSFTSCKSKICLPYKGMGYASESSVRRKPPLKSYFSGDICILEEDCYIVRPLLSISRIELNKICYFWKLPIYPDKSNQKVKFFRNRVRGQLLPTIKLFFNLNIENIFLQLAKIIETEDYCLTQIVNEFTKNTDVYHSKLNIYSKKNNYQTPDATLPYPIRVRGMGTGTKSYPPHAYPLPL